MELSTLFGWLSSAAVDDYLFWGIASLSGIVGVVAIVNALDLVYEAEVG
ncbi:conserved hypothetical protein [Burkholderiales bacterium 8X]|nr:conserved hypothetical protein [Burkholderiales bacterium 8X]